AMYYEADINTLLYCRFIGAPFSSSGYAICEDRVGDTDDVGWQNGLETVEDISINMQTPYQDLGHPHCQKQWNMLEVDADANDGLLTVRVLFDDGNSFTLGTMDLVGRAKYEFPINAGFGYEAYRMSVQITGAGLNAPPNLYQLNIYAAQLAANRNTYDTYWIKFSIDESKLIKEGYFDYTSTEPIVVSLYADGATTAYYTFILPANPNRSSVPQRVRF